MAQIKRARKNNFSEGVVEVILLDVELKPFFVLFTSASISGTGTARSKAWKEVFDAVNTVSSVIATIQEVKRI